MSERMMEADVQRMTEEMVRQDAAFLREQMMAALFAEVSERKDGHEVVFPIADPGLHLGWHYGIPQPAPSRPVSRRRRLRTWLYERWEYVPWAWWRITDAWRDRRRATE